MPHLLFWLSAACIALAWAIWGAGRLLIRPTPAARRRAAGIAPAALRPLPA
jgi:hypothetical protein